MRTLPSIPLFVTLCLAASPGCDKASDKPAVAKQADSRVDDPQTDEDTAKPSDAAGKETAASASAKDAKDEPANDDAESATEGEALDVPAPDQLQAIGALTADENWRPTGPFASVKFEPGPLKIEPEKAGDGELPHGPSKDIDPDIGTFMDHLTKFGWSGDGKTFAHCFVGGGECNQCTFVALDGSQQSKCEEEDPDRWAKEKFDKGPVEWPYGSEVTLQWEAVPNPEVSGKDLVLHASVDGSEAKADVATMPLRDLDSQGAAFPEVLSLSADGTKLAIVGHGWQGEGTDDFVLRLLDTGAVAAEAYNAAGLALLRAGKHEAAAKRFLQASVAAPTLWKGPYNAACAYAKLSDPRAQATLHEAVRRGGDQVKAKAKRDADLDPVRKKGWYTSLIER